MELNVDNSRLEPLAKCTTMAVLQSVHGMRGKGEKHAADCGTAAHEAWLSWFVGEPGDSIRALDIFEREYKLMIGDAAVEDRLKLHNLKRIMGTWFEKHEIGRFPFEVVSGEETVGYEIDDGVWFWGKRDLLVRDKETKLLSPLDHKTTGRVLGDWWMRDFRLKSQLSGYNKVTSVEGNAGEVCYINAVRFSKLPENMKWKCRTHKVKYEECWKEHVDYLLFKVFRNEFKVQGWERDAKWLANRLGLLVQAYPSVELAKWAPKEGTFNGSCTFCGFNRWCQMDCNENMIDELMVHDPWEPWKGERVRRLG